MIRTTLRDHAFAIWSAGVDAVRPEPLIANAVRSFPPEWWTAIRSAPGIRVVGGGKAGAGMAVGLEAALANCLDRVTGLLNVPEGLAADLRRLRLHPARPAGSNHPTAEGVAGADEMLALLTAAGPNDVAFCLLSGGGSALLPAPAEGISLADKQAVTKLLHASGATIGEMNAVRKHLSRVKGGGLAAAFRGKLLVSLIVSDVIGDPLDVIASGPTAPDPTTFADAYAVLAKFDLLDRTPPSVMTRLRDGIAGKIPETPKELPASIHNRIIGSNRIALDAAVAKAVELEYQVIDLGATVAGETTDVAARVCELVHTPTVTPPACILLGGETTVTLGDHPGKGGRNQEFVLAMATRLGLRGLAGCCVLSGGTDGEDGPTDAAGAIADVRTLRTAAARGIDPHDFLVRHDAYHFFDATGDLIRIGLTGTNVMDLRLVLVT